MNLLVTIWICSLHPFGLPNAHYYGSGLSQEEAEKAAARACFADGNRVCIVNECTSEPREEDRD